MTFQDMKPGDVTSLPPALHRVSEGDRMACFDLLAEGVDSHWLKVVPPGQDNGLPSSIPYRIIQYWHAANPPEDVRRSVATTIAMNPECQHELVCDASARAFMYQEHGNEGLRLFDCCFHPAMRADFWRIAALYKHGGIYMDVDTCSHAPVTRIAAGADFSCLLTYSFGSPWCVDNDFIMTQPNHPVIGAILEGIFANLTRYCQVGDFENIWVETGPGVTTIASMRWLSRIVNDQPVAGGHGGLAFRHHNAIAEAFDVIDMDYKKTRLGNWRRAVPS